MCPRILFELYFLRETFGYDIISFCAICPGEGMDITIQGVNGHVNKDNVSITSKTKDNLLLPDIGKCSKFLPKICLIVH